MLGVFFKENFKVKQALIPSLAWDWYKIYTRDDERSKAAFWSL
jgi:hypothetical protein